MCGTLLAQTLARILMCHSQWPIFVLTEADYVGEDVKYYLQSFTVLIIMEGARSSSVY